MSYPNKSVVWTEIKKNYFKKCHKVTSLKIKHIPHIFQFHIIDSFKINLFHKF